MSPNQLSHGHEGWDSSGLRQKQKPVLRRRSQRFGANPHLDVPHHLQPWKFEVPSRARQKDPKQDSIVENY